MCMVSQDSIGTAEVEMRLAEVNKGSEGVIIPRIIHHHSSQLSAILCHCPLVHNLISIPLAQSDPIHSNLPAEPYRYYQNHILQTGM